MHPAISLRRSCHACVKSKRRCIPQLPRCDRCAKKQVSCVYDLEPVARTGEVLCQGEQDVGGSGGGVRVGGGRNGDQGEENAQESPRIVYYSVKAAREAAMSAMASGCGAGSDASRPKMFGSVELVQWVVGFLSDAVRDGLAGRGTPFIHRHIVQPTPMSIPVSMLTTPPTPSDPDQPTTKATIFAQLTTIHNLIIQCLTLLLNKSSGNTAANNPDSDLSTLVTTMFSTTHTLWSSPPPSFLTHIYTPWEAWLTAESTRRSMFAAQIIKGLYSFMTLGYVPYEPFFESLPFDPRAGLWEASDEEGWERVLRKRHGADGDDDDGNVGGNLKSYHEFITGTAEDRIDPAEDGKFQRLLFLCYHCDDGLRYIKRLEADEPS